MGIYTEHMETKSQASAINRYKVLPFSCPSYHKNFAKLASHEYGCAICGKPVAYPYAHPAVVVNGGDWASMPEEEANESDSGYMGVWGIGPDCHQKHFIKPTKQSRMPTIPTNNFDYCLALPCCRQRPPRYAPSEHRAASW